MISLESNLRFVIFLILVLCVSCTKTEKDASQPQTKRPVDGATSAETFVGTSKCAECHQKEYRLWMGSDHEKAMQPANSRTVLGDFNNRSFSYNGTTSAFYKRDNTFFVRTDGLDGKIQEFKIITHSASSRCSST